MDGFPIAELQYWLQPIDSILRELSLHAYSYHYLLLAAILYWAGYRSLASRLGVVVLFSTLIFGGCRQFFPAQRPYWLDPGLFNGVKESGYGMPSGHSQNAVVFWGIIAASIRKSIVILIALLMIALLAVSRLYLGVHFLSQVVWGLAIGAVLVFCIMTCEKCFLSWFNRQQQVLQLLLAFLVALIPMLVILSLRELVEIGEGNGASKPYQRLIFLSGMTVGMTTGLTFSKGKFLQKPSMFLWVTRVLPGIASVCLLWSFSSGLSTGIDRSVVVYLVEGIRGLLIVWWGVWFWPGLHRKMEKAYSR
ncbi:hypothetical protein CI610_02089 [invertebrate metagenome]|uniref:Phosphatidic acid phosphatase type 2/haloperoxidase domain-containing protein n=1 Tax=invertebrate metagenome TaxID=1711999 RepID=A0A2H9T6X5_9ZZZZ